jgi:ferric-dicitrate binding protein FerR (iron transport regulator)
MNALFPLPVAATAPAAVDPVYAAIERHRQAYDVFMDVWDRTRGAMDLYERAKTDKAAAAELRRFSELEMAEETAFHTLLAIRPMTKAGAIACVEHVADYGLATEEMRAWLAMLIESPLVAEPNSQRRITR